MKMVLWVSVVLAVLIVGVALSSFPGTLLVLHVMAHPCPSTGRASRPSNRDASVDVYILGNADSVYVPFDEGADDSPLIRTAVEPASQSSIGDPNRIKVQVRKDGDGLEWAEAKLGLREEVIDPNEW